jgi:hypothetical protein
MRYQTNDYLEADRLAARMNAAVPNSGRYVAWTFSDGVHGVAIYRGSRLAGICGEECGRLFPPSKEDAYLQESIRCRRISSAMILAFIGGG